MGEIGRRLGPQAEPLHPARQAFIPQGETALVSLTLVSLKSSPRVAIRVWWLPPSNKLPLDASHPLIKAVARANSWMERLLSGQVASLEGLASETGFTKRYISRTLRSAFLAPDIQKGSSMAYRHLT
jgi:hypothetical protein